MYGATGGSRDTHSRYCIVPGTALTAFLPADRMGQSRARFQTPRIALNCSSSSSSTVRQTAEDLPVPAGWKPGWFQAFLFASDAADEICGLLVQRS